MVNYMARRLAQGLLVLYVAVTAVFFLSRASGDPAMLYLPADPTPGELAAIRTALGLDQPVPVQYERFVLRLMQGDLGNSFFFQAPVRDLIGNTLPNTAVLALAAFAFAAIGGVTLGTLAALNSGRRIDSLTRIVAVLGQSVPSFWLGMVLILVFAAQLRILPAFGNATAVNLILPAIALGALPMASTARLTRSATLDVLRADHTLFTRSKGVSQSLFLTHVLRNAALPINTLSGIQLGALLGGSVVIETLFAWPGMGQLAIQALNGRDYSVVQGVVLTDTAIFVTLNLLVDVINGWIDPRVRRQ